MSVGEATYGEMLEDSHLDNDTDFWIRQILEEASSVYSERKGVNAGLSEARTTSECYDAYVLENKDLGRKIVGFEVRPLFSDDYGAGFGMRPEEDSPEYEDFKEAIFEAIESDVDRF